MLRFRWFVARVDAGEGLPGRPDLARLAADTGYADQAHLTMSASGWPACHRPP